MISKEFVALFAGCSVVSMSIIITGEYVTTPKVIMREELIRRKAEYCFGYDPIDKQFKVLRVTWYAYPTQVRSGRYHVLTLGTGNRNLLWRKIRCRTLHLPLYDNGICIDGVLFYTAMTSEWTQRIVCFNVRTEEFSFINVVDTQIAASSILINFKGKLCVIDRSNHYTLWVLEDAKKHKWSKYMYQLPLALMNEVRPVGITASGEIVLCSTLYPTFRQYHFYYNPKSNIIKRVIRLEDPVFDDFRLQTVHTFFNHVEDVELM